MQIQFQKQRFARKRLQDIQQHSKTKLAVLAKKLAIFARNRITKIGSQMVNIYAIWIEIENVLLHLWKKSNIKDALCEKLDKKFIVANTPNWLCKPE